MTPLDEEEQERMKNYLSIYQKQQQTQNETANEELDGLNDSTSHPPEGSKDILSNQQLTTAELGSSVDWTKVGRPYKASSGIDSVIEKEMARLKIALDKRMVI